jgi:membrane protein implicated in regulation of membrane protease activity
MEQSTLWWILAGLAVAAELMTGTFYLLMFACGLIAAAIAAHLGTSTFLQIAICAVVGGSATLAWHFFKSKKEAALAAPAQANRDVNMDVGETVQISDWRDDGTTSVRYRGAPWEVAVEEGTPREAGAYKIEKVVGSRLVVSKLSQN